MICGNRCGTTTTYAMQGSRVFGHGSVVFGFVVLGIHQVVLLFPRVGNLLVATRARPCGLCAHVANKVWRWTKVVWKLTCQRVKEGCRVWASEAPPFFPSFGSSSSESSQSCFCKLD